MSARDQLFNLSHEQLCNKVRTHEEKIAKLEAEAEHDREALYAIWYAMVLSWLKFGRGKSRKERILAVKDDRDRKAHTAPLSNIYCAIQHYKKAGHQDAGSAETYRAVQATSTAPSSTTRKLDTRTLGVPKPLSQTGSSTLTALACRYSNLPRLAFLSEGFHRQMHDRQACAAVSEG